jgi:hypothetical protein
MFQPIRPPVRWSRVANRRASACGFSTVVEAVTTTPSLRVAAAMAETRTTGSPPGRLIASSIARSITRSCSVG